MYESFFGFKEKPFNITPDPKYLYLSEQHQEAIAHLLYGIHERGGFVVVTGEIGTGKTTLCRYLVNEMDDRIEGAVIFNPNLSELELLKAINQDFGIASVGQTKKELVDELNQFLLEERLRGKNMVLIIDEAQNLHPSVLEQVRMLSNLETEKEKLIQIILVGQPQLKKLLARSELKQLDQRVTARYHLKPLNRQETYHYIQHRLDIAGPSTKVSFDSAALKLIYKVSKGIPRLINVICDRALLGAFAAGQPSPISKSVVKQAIREVLGHRRSFSNRLPIAVAARVLSYALALSVLGIVGWYAFKTLNLVPLRSGARAVELIPDDVAPKPQADISTIPQERLAEASPFVAPEVQGPAGGRTPAEEAAADAPSAEDMKQTLVELLTSADMDTSRASAGKNLLALWGRYPEMSSDIARSFYAVAMSQQLRCAELWTNFDGLRSSNMPCILEMFVPQEMNPRYLVLARVQNDMAKIFYADAQPLDVPLSVLDEFWLRRAFVFWKDFEQTSEALKLGDSGGQVVWLQAGLQEIGVYGGQLTGQFDQTTEEAVLKFQQQCNLLPDGIVGSKTKLAMYANLKQYSVPRLTGEST